jgi:hypothetical protein
MGVFSCSALDRCLEFHPDANAAALIRTRLTGINELAALLPLYDQVIPLVETALWTSALDPDRVKCCHALFAEMEGHIAAAGNDRRHKLVVVVPVADRPQQLRTCLMSLVGAAQAFSYPPGKLTVVIADDSRSAEHIAENRVIADEIRQRGGEALYFGQAEQLAELDALAPDDRQALRNIIGSAASGSFYHKGASIMRNITYLMLNRMAQRDADLLFLFVDSDQEFHANTDASRKVFTSNYFYHIDRIFRQYPVEVLTGKVVGDPPVFRTAMMMRPITTWRSCLVLSIQVKLIVTSVPCRGRMTMQRACLDLRAGSITSSMVNIPRG